LVKIVQLSEQISQKALELGFDLVGITDASPLPAVYIENIKAWLDAGYAGRMTWMHKGLEKRVNPASLLPGARSVIVVALNYKTSMSLRAECSEAKQSQPFGTVASYARYEDYHPFIKKQLRKLVDFLIHTAGPGLKFKICVDSSPLLERALAQKAGLGFIGKNHMLINPTFGPQLLLGEIITNLEIKSLNGCGCATRFVERQTLNATDTSSAADRRKTQPAAFFTGCGSCDKCVAACPTGALRPDGYFNAAKCINYLTIESDTEIPSDLATKIGSHLFGCSECLLACPYHQNAPPCANSQFTYYPDRAQLNLKEILNLTEDRFQTQFAGSPILRPGLSRLKHVAGICLENFSHREV
jgi:epoxyqueuosine reductase